MPLAAINEYMAKLASLKAQSMLMLGEAATVPHMELDDRQAWSARLQDVIGGEQQAKPASEAQLALAGITLEKVGPDGLTRRGRT